MECQAGEYSSANRSTGCETCAAGQFSGQNGSSGCGTCLVDTYSQAGATACTACPLGHFSLALTGSTGCRTCVAGSFFRVDEQRRCQACQRGNYTSTGGATECLVCPAGSFSLDVATACSACEHGKFLSAPGGSACLACSPGQYSSGTGEVGCDECMAGTFVTGAGAWECENCSAGTFSVEDGVSVCEPCGPGTFSKDVGVRFCVECSAGRYSSGEGATACLDCDAGFFGVGERRSVCTACFPGTFSTGTGVSYCSNCTAGTYYPLAAGNVCLACGAGRYSTTIGMTSSAGCVGCEAGRYLSATTGTACDACEAGTYSEGRASVCLACPVDSDSPGGTTLEGCVCEEGLVERRNRTALACIGCSPGQYSFRRGSTSCGDCAMGEYSLGGQVIGCALCQPGTYGDGVKRSACTSCPAGTFVGYQGATQCEVCRAGFSAGGGLSTCQACQPGTFSDGKGARECKGCLAGTYTTMVQAVGCDACPAGAFQGMPAQTGCLLCPNGTFSGVVGLANATCESCPGGYYSTREGLTDAEGCLRCPVGKNSDPGATACGDCRPGEFPNEVYGACAGCPLHSVPGGNASRPEDCRCLPGYEIGYNARGVGGVEEGYTGLMKVHVLDAMEKIRLFVQATVSASCAGEQVLPPTVLPAGDYLGEASCNPPRIVQYEVDVRADPRETQTYVQCRPCRPGTYSTGDSWVGACQVCPSKTYQDLQGQGGCKPCLSGAKEKLGMPVCEPCPVPTAVQDGECRPCPPGTFFSAFLGEPRCLPCPNNMWSDVDSDGCRLCPANSVGPGGSTLAGCRCNAGLEMRVEARIPYCGACAAGKYAAQGGNVCVACRNGTFSAQAGAGACTACPSYGVAWGGATACKSCALPTVPSGDGGSCVTCPAGYYCGIGKVYACPLGTYSTKTGLTSKGQCPLCPRNSFCRSPLTIQACPANTWSPSGSVTRHYCVCNSGYKCLYSFSTVGNVNVALTPEQFEAQKDQIVQALARAAGVDPSLVKIVAVSHQTP